jgi:hypothetical protein
VLPRKEKHPHLPLEGCYALFFLRSIARVDNSTFLLYNG